VARGIWFRGPRFFLTNQSFSLANLMAQTEPDYATEPPADGFGHLIWRADRLLVPLEYVLTFIGGALVFVLMILGMIQIVMRNVFNAPIFGYIDIVEFGMIGFAIFGISYVQRAGGHVRMELIVGRLKGRAMWFVELLGVAVGIFIVTILIPYSYEHFARAWDLGDSTIDIELVVWPGKLAVPVLLSILLLRFVLQFLAYLRLFVKPGLKPVGAPHIKTVEQQAAEEIEGTT